MMFQSSKQMAVFWCGLLILSLAVTKSEEKKICDIGLTISEDFYSSDSESIEGNGNINNRSLSAWNWILDISLLRIPSVIFKAECQAESCTYPHGQQDTKLISSPIYREVLVLKQAKQDRKCFIASYEKVVVGCTCVRPQYS